MQINYNLCIRTKEACKQTNKKQPSNVFITTGGFFFFFRFHWKFPYSHIIVGDKGTSEFPYIMYSMFYPFFLLFPLQLNIPSVLSPPSMDVFLWLPWVPSSETSQQFTFCSFQGRTDRRHYPMGINSIDLLYSRYFNYFF